ncbi:hypothetical protein D3C71_1374800 [compost metagenome]
MDSLLALTELPLLSTGWTVACTAAAGTGRPKPPQRIAAADRHNIVLRLLVFLNRASKITASFCPGVELNVGTSDKAFIID